MKKAIPFLIFTFYSLHVATSQIREPDQLKSVIEGAETSENKGWCITTDANAVHEVWVDASNTSGIEDGTPEHPFNTIKEGIALAMAGETVMVKAGTYHPDEIWSGNTTTLFLKAGVQVKGEGKDNTIIQGIVVDQEISNLSTGVELLRFDAYHFTRGTHEGPFTDPNIIKNCSAEHIDISFGPGIPVNDTTPGPNYGFLIENNELGADGIVEFSQGAGVSDLTVKNTSCGYIYLKSGAGYTYRIENNDIQYGILDASGVNTTTLSGNTIHDGAIIDRSGGNQWGIVDQIIENNVINAGENSPIFDDDVIKGGIVTTARSGTIRNNSIVTTGQVHGIYSSAGAPLHINGNTITLEEMPTPGPLDEGVAGILNVSGWGTVTGNTIHGGKIGYYSKAGTIEFANNLIKKSYTGFFSMGAEEVHHNTIHDSFSDGMILDGLKGPIHHNEVSSNGGAGIRVTRIPVDLGGGADGSPGKNTLRGNGNYDLYVETVNTLNPVLFARYNFWDHDNAADISQFDIRDGNDSTGLVTVDFTPWGGMGVEEPVARELVIYPNPVADQLRITNQESMIMDYSLEITDMFGKILVQKMGSANSREIVLSLSDLTPGIYCFRMLFEKQIVVKKFVKK